tara:strand:+ start:609 stop:851 length:243 start_codon:yes stop_codon:yes gene_type:complete
MGDEMNYQTPRPEGKVWEKATLYKIYVMEQRLPICGYRSVWAIKGRKWVRCCEPISWKKFRMKLEDFNKVIRKDNENADN